MDLSLEQRAKDALSSRLKTSANYSAQEISEIAKLERKLFPHQAIDKETTELFRRLCALSNIRLLPSREITSHRPIVGPLIVAIKRISYPFIRVHLKGVIEALEEFCAWSVYAHAKSHRRVN